MMNLAMNEHRLTKPGPQNVALRDYDSVRRAIAFISERWRAQPTIEAMADAASVTPDELHHLFRRWAGLTPKAFMQALTLDHAKGLLRDSASVLDAALDSGLSGPGRLHDLFVTHEAMSPGEWKNGGAGMTLRYGFHPSPFGTAIVIASGRGLAGLAFAIPAKSRPHSPTCSGVGRAQLTSKTAQAPLTWRSASSTKRCGAPTSRCAWC
jgi:AraC family transcriptional regulator of adaptative response/methylated-DNA-[protein]-cysteine methyltransferase